MVSGLFSAVRAEYNRAGWAVEYINGDDKAERPLKNWIKRQFMLGPIQDLRKQFEVDGTTMELDQVRPYTRVAQGGVEAPTTGTVTRAEFGIFGRAKAFEINMGPDYRYDARGPDAKRRYVNVSMELVGTWFSEIYPVDPDGIVRVPARDINREARKNSFQNARRSFEDGDVKVANYEFQPEHPTAVHRLSKDHLIKDDWSKSMASSSGRPND